MQSISDQSKGITHLKLCEQGDKIRLTFHWPMGIQAVYIFATNTKVENVLHPRQGKLFTLQEYKSHGGYITPVTKGQMYYYVLPLVEGEETEQFSPHDDCYIGYMSKTTITYTLIEKTEKNPWWLDSRYTHWELTLMASHPVPKGVIIYEVGETRYCLYEPIEANTPLVRMIRVAKNENIQLYVGDDTRYGLVQK